MLAELILSRFLPKGVGTTAARGTGVGSVATASVEPVNLEMTRAGRRFMLTISAAVTGIAPVQAIPTTAAQWTIWNNEPSGGATYYFEELGEILVSGTPGLGGSVWACVYSTPSNTGGQAAGFTVQNASQGARASKAIIKSGVSITTPSAPGWYQLNQTSDAVAAAAFSTGYANGFTRTDLAGAVSIQPQQGLGLAVIAPAGTTPLYAPLARWVEVETDNE